MILSPRVLTKRQSKQFIAHYAGNDLWHNQNPDSGDLGYGYFYYGLIRAMNLSRILVIGSKYGFVPAICALALKHNTHGIVDFVDAGYDQENLEHTRHWGGVGLWRKPDPLHHFRKFSLSRYIRIHVTTSQLFFASKTPADTWQFVFIDGDHSYKGVSHDYKRSYAHGYLQSSGRSSADIY